MGYSHSILSSLRDTRTQVTDQGPSSRTNATDLRKISSGVYTELAEGVEMTTHAHFHRSAELTVEAFARVTSTWLRLIPSRFESSIGDHLAKSTAEFSYGAVMDEVRILIQRRRLAVNDRQQRAVTFGEDRERGSWLHLQR